MFRKVGLTFFLYLW